MDEKLLNALTFALFRKGCERLDRSKLQCHSSIYHWTQKTEANNRFVGFEFLMIPRLKALVLTSSKSAF